MSDNDEGRMTLVEHLTELRKRMIICILAIFVCGVLMFMFYNRVLSFLAGPYEHVTRGQTACGGTKTHGCSLIATGPLDPLIVRLKVAGYGGLALAIPIIFWEIWRFVTPGLHKHERRYGVAFLVSAVLLFLLGVVVAWFTTTKALEFLLGAGGSSIQPFITADKYLTLVTLMMAAFGIAFEFPLLLVFLLLVNVINTRQLRHFRRWAAVGITTFAAVITPSADPFSLLFMAVPMYIFYEIAIIIGRVMKR
ncbi:MAG TPA: twin-arginine translocase subunit TatC [Acidimicrobiia bacterium]|nr:twin-arginine translocase subunit TatC [Acidimicrobiia bacterium]